MDEKPKGTTTKYTISEDAWQILNTAARSRDHKLEGENADRNEDGTYTVELEDSFVVGLKVKGTWKIGETLEDFLIRSANAVASGRRMQ